MMIRIECVTGCGESIETRNVASALGAGWGWTRYHDEDHFYAPECYQARLLAVRKREKNAKAWAGRRKAVTG